MGRAAGQIDEAKTEAILEAAATLFAEKGATASMAQIARLAGVSKQTLYNRYPAKIDLARALASRRSDAITAPLRSGGAPEAVLTGMAVSLLEKVCGGDMRHSMRGVALMSPQFPELAEAVYRAGPAEGLRRLSQWLAEQDRLGLLSVPDPDRAAEMFNGMVLGHSHLRSLLGIPHPAAADVSAYARETVHRFLRAYAV